MSYRLVVLTHGRSATLEPTLVSFAEHVRPLPNETIVVDDGSQGLALKAHALPSARVLGHTPALGFCGATRLAWNAAREPGADYVFWLEHDFVFLRDVDLADLQATVSLRRLAQMSLCRGAANSNEEALGGLVAAYRGSMRPFEARTPRGTLRWLEHEAYWTTNPSLIPRSTLDRPWPDGPECEGKFGADLRAAGGKVGLWGDGEPWVDHIGQRTGFGY